MANEEKIKAFFSNEEKVKALANDEEFMEKISGGTATAETYKDELKKFGLELSDDEAKIVQKTVAKAMDTPTEKLDDSFLESIAGGKVTGKDVAVGAGVVLGGAAGAAWLAGMGSAIAAEVYLSKAKRAYNHGDDINYKKYMAKAERCDRIGGDIASFGITAALRKYENS